MSDKSIRVLRLMEYIYPDAETAMRDMERWQVQGTYSPRSGFTIRSTTLPMEMLDTLEEPIAAAAGRPMTDAEVKEALCTQVPRKDVT